MPRPGHPWRWGGPDAGSGGWEVPSSHGVPASEGHGSGLRWGSPKPSPPLDPYRGAGAGHPVRAPCPGGARPAGDLAVPEEGPAGCQRGSDGAVRADGGSLGRPTAPAGTWERPRVGPSAGAARAGFLEGRGRAAWGHAAGSGAESRAPAEGLAGDASLPLRERGWGTARTPQTLSYASVPLGRPAPETAARVGLPAVSQGSPPPPGSPACRPPAARPPRFPERSPCTRGRTLAGSRGRGADGATWWP